MSSRRGRICKVDILQQFVADYPEGQRFDLALVE